MKTGPPSIARLLVVSALVVLAGHGVATMLGGTAVDESSDTLTVPVDASEGAQQQHPFLSHNDEAVSSSSSLMANSTPEPAQANSTTHHVRPGRVFLIRHGEKLKGGRQGLAEKGKVRAQCLKHVFGHGPYKVDYIMAQAYKPDGRRSRPYQTVKPLADYLGLDVDTHCEREEADCVARRALRHVEQGKSVLICWQHKALTDVARAFGVRGLRYPPSRSDMLFQLSSKGKVAAIRSEECSGLDDAYRGWHGSKRMRPEDKLVDDEAWAPGAGDNRASHASPSSEETQAREGLDREMETLLAEYDIDELSDVLNSDGQDAAW